MSHTATSHMPPQTCPICSSKLDAATPAFGGKTKVEPGDVTVCMYCCQVLQFEEGYTLAALFGDDIPADVRPQIALIQATIREMWTEHPEHRRKP